MDYETWQMWRDGVPLTTEEIVEELHEIATLLAGDPWTHTPDEL